MIIIQQSIVPKKKINKKGQCYYSFFPHLCFKVALCSSYRESLELSLSYTSGNFHYRTWLVYSNDGLPQIALGLREQASWMHNHLVSFVELSYIYSSSASVAWQSLLLALTSIDGHLYSPLISLVDVRLSPFLSSQHNPHHYSIQPIVLYPWLTLMYCVRVENAEAR